MQQGVFPVRLRLFEGTIRSVREKCAWLRMQEPQVRLDAATGDRDPLRRELDQRLEIIEQLKQKVVNL
jgi:hypothetical protein